MKRFVFCSFLSCLVLLGAILTPGARADVKLPSVLGSHMVLQRDKPLPIWGWADPGEEVTVQIDQEPSSPVKKADEKGAWKMSLPAMKADGKSHKLVIKGKNKIELEDVLIGEVWIGAGQSNMDVWVAYSHNAKEAIPAADQPKIRLFKVPHVEKPTPQTNVQAAWEVCTPKTVGPFSGVLYHFGLALQKELDVPVGLMQSSVNGSLIEWWMVEDVFADVKRSGGLHNGMIAPLQPFAIRGVVWYQGEFNVTNGLKYRDRMEVLIKGWRKTWGEDMPFYFVQIAPYSGYGSLLPLLWEAQAATLKLPKTGMAVITDLVPNLADIHPPNKKDVGKRLALWALAKDYGKKDLVYSGPLYKGMKIDGNKIRLQFAHVGTGLKTRDDKPLSEFQIAGEDGKFVPAEAVIDGSEVVVQSKGVTSPTQVRFGWRYVANPNLINKEGLPASPFQTRDWTGGAGE
jgi:sialate O-acetylesterase